MRPSLRHLLFIAACLSMQAAAQPELPLVSGSPDPLLAAREAWRTHDPGPLPALERLRTDAERALKDTPHSVMEKSQTPASGDKHDYMSLARYYWPDTTKPGGLPYVSRDGLPNPEINTITDAAYCARMINTVRTLGLAYFIFGDERYAAHAANHLRVWFLDSATRMNPHLTHAQAVRGLDDGRPAGTIETRDLGYVCDAASMLAGSPAWPAAEHERLRTWFSDYFHWIQNHPRAKAAARMENNISIWFAVQASSIGLFVGRREEAAAIIAGARDRIFATQIEPDGSQPLELRRTTSKHYVCFNITAYFRLAACARQAGMDLWNYRTSDGRSLRSALDWVIPYISGSKTWTWKQIKAFDWDDYVPILMQAASIYRDSSYTQIASRIAAPGRAAGRFRLTGEVP